MSVLFLTVRVFFFVISGSVLVELAGAGLTGLRFPFVALTGTESESDESEKDGEFFHGDRWIGWEEQKGKDRGAGFG